jgi:hypothetical protein
MSDPVLLTRVHHRSFLAPYVTQGQTYLQAFKPSWIELWLGTALLLKVLPVHESKTGTITSEDLRTIPKSLEHYSLSMLRVCGQSPREHRTIADAELRLCLFWCSNSVISLNLLDLLQLVF